MAKKIAKKKTSKNKRKKTKKFHFQKERREKSVYQIFKEFVHTLKACTHVSVGRYNHRLTKASPTPQFGNKCFKKRISCTHTWKLFPCGLFQREKMWLKMWWRKTQVGDRMWLPAGVLESVEKGFVCLFLPSL